MGKKLINARAMTLKYWEPSPQGKLHSCLFSP